MYPLLCNSNLNSQNWSPNDGSAAALSSQAIPARAAEALRQQADAWARNFVRDAGRPFIRTLAA